MPNRNDADLFENLKSYVSLIGRGQKSGKTLSQAQARHLMQHLLNGDALPEQVGAILMLLRMREETVEELSGFLQACRDTISLSLPSDVPIAFDFGAYAGKRRHLPWFLLVAMALAESGENVFIHGLEENDSQRLYLDTVYRELGWQQAESSEQAREQLAQFGFTYMSIEHFHPAMTSLLKTRHILGLRSCLHSLSKMLNPANAQCSIHGIFHRDLDTIHIDVAKTLNENHVACIRGDSGEVEVTPEKPFTMHSLEDGEKLTREFPVLMQQWALQTRNLGAIGLKQVWTGNQNNQYGENAVLGTLAVALACKYSLNLEASFKKAKQVWLGRSGRWPKIV
jgi:anthranilate phosphoribosyltransferase